MPKIIKDGVTYAGIPAINYDCEVSDITLYAANWNSTTKVYTISDARIDATSVQEYMPAVGITDTQLEALQAANIADGGQDTGHAYLKAYGDLPEIDIPIRVMFNPGVKTKEVENDTYTLLWENESISADFAPQTIAIDLSSYSSVMVVACENWSSETRKNYLGSAITLVGSRGTVFVPYQGTIKNRQYSVTTTGIAFETSYSSDNSSTATGAYAIPRYIYGIK